MPKVIDKKEKRTQILDAATRVFAQKGAGHTKIADIAEAAGIGKGTVYEYFHSKDEILAASFRYFIEAGARVVEQRLYSLTDPLDRLRAYFHAWAEMFDSDYMNYMEVVLDFWAQGIRRDKERLTFDLAELYAQYRKTLEGLLNECVIAGCIASVDTRITAAILLGALDGLLLQWIMDRTLFDIKEAVEFLPQLLVRGVKKEET